MDAPVSEAIRNEREACARIAVRKSILWSQYEDQQSDEFRRGVEWAASAIARAIRSRS